MKTLSETAALLREFADALDTAKKNLLLPTEQTDIPAAAEQLRLLLGVDNYFSIRMELAYNPYEPPEVSWSIWDGTKFYERHTLQDTLKAAKAARAPVVQGDPIEAIRMAEAALDPLPL